MLHYFLAYKPYGMLSQFSPDCQRHTLAMLRSFPSDVYPIGRLDADSEGLLIITNDKTLNQRLLNPNSKISKVYLAQIEGIIHEGALAALRSGVVININGKKHRTAPAQVQVIEAPALPDRIPPIRFRASIPTSWISISITEGKNRQVRRMTAAVGYPTLRLVRKSIGPFELDAMTAGNVIELKREAFYDKLNKFERLNTYSN